jgi:hypothetical protein
VRVVVLLLLAACGGATPATVHPEPATLDDAIDGALVDAAAKHDVNAIAGFLVAPIEFGDRSRCDPRVRELPRDPAVTMARGFWSTRRGSRSS